ncbi:MAG TPA: ATP-binding cassette domain-containing protein, partial [Thermoanaerobaculia bacterium]|nr:ATP-binding cassette domain-containing protein [Thermoanaerobaculia bacterium]
MAGVRLEKVGKTYGETRVLSGLDLDVLAGEFLVLVGPSGCGKST